MMRALMGKRCLGGIFLQKLIRPVQDLFGQTCKFSDVDSIAAIRSARHNAPQKDHIVAFFLHGDGIVLDAIKKIFQFNQFMIMSCK